jgi:YggT family protein
MSAIGSILVFVLNLFILSLFARVVLDLVRTFSPSWRPQGIILAIAELVYAITDPVTRFARRFIPPLRLGAVALDISFLLIFFITEILISFAHRIH